MGIAALLRRSPSKYNRRDRETVDQVLIVLRAHLGLGSLMPLWEVEKMPAADKALTLIQRYFGRSTKFASEWRKLLHFKSEPKLIGDLLLAILAEITDRTKFSNNLQTRIFLRSRLVEADAFFRDNVDQIIPLGL